MVIFRELTETEKRIGLPIFKTVKIGGRVVGFIILIGFLVFAAFNSKLFIEDPTSGFTVAIMNLIVACWFILMSWLANKMIISVEENGTTWKWLKRNV